MNDPDALRTIIEDIFLRQQLWTLLWVLMVAILSAASAFFGAYFKQRGETYATKQDFETLLTQLKSNTRATEDIKARIGRRSEFEKHILLEQYKLVTRLQTQIGNIATDLNRRLHGQEVADLIKDNEIKPLTAVYIELESSRYLINDLLYQTLHDQAQWLRTFANVRDKNRLEYLTALRIQHLKQFREAMKIVFGLDEITWHHAEEANNQETNK